MRLAEIKFKRISGNFSGKNFDKCYLRIDRRLDLRSFEFTIALKIHESVKYFHR